jgi:hypothetical protein
MEPIDKLRFLVESAEGANDTPSEANVKKAQKTWDHYLRTCARIDAVDVTAHPDYLFLIGRLKGVSRDWIQRANVLLKAQGDAAEKAKVPKLRLVRTGEGENTEREPVTWAALAKVQRPMGQVAPGTLSNIATILDTDSRWKGRVKLNTFARKVEVGGDMISDAAVLQASVWMDRIYGVSVAKQTVQDALTLTANENPYNPIADYLLGLRWDGKPRTPHLFTGYIVGRADTEQARGLLHAFGVRWMIGAVARVFEPGCKVDTLPVLYGAKGVKKSSAFSALAGEQSWFADTALDPAKKDAMEQLQGVWLYEWSEFDIWLKRRGENRIRNFLSRQVDHFRWTHAVNVEDRPRQGVFVASTNEPEFMTDPERRFWPVHALAVDLDAIRADRDQLWAEAVARYKEGTQWHLTEEEDKLLVTFGADFEQSDPWEDLIAKTLDETVQIDGGTYPKMPTPFSIAQLLGAMGFTARDMTKDAENRAGQCLRAMGYLKARKRDGSGRSWVWSHPDAS